MISISKPQGAAQAKDYLSKESYYQQNGELGQWHGSKEALSYLGLEENEAIEKQTYAAVLNGMHPKSGKPLLSNSGSEKRRAGIDVTFSAPKSVSLLMTLCEGLGNKATEKKIRAAHESAVQYAMDQISRHYAKTRIRKGKGKREMVSTQAVWASFQHDTTRQTDAGEIDPQLHTHNFLMSMTFHKDPATGKLTPYAMSNEEIYANKMYLGQVYRNALAKNMVDLGFPIEVTDIDLGFFELEGFTSQQLDTFSGRHTELLEKLANSDLKSDNTAKMLDLINAKTKNYKKKIDRASLLERNLKRMQQVGMDSAFLESILSATKHPSPKPSRSKKKELILEHLHKSLDLLEEHHSVFGYEEVMKHALKFGLRYGYTLTDYQQAFHKMMQQGRLIQLDNNIYSTQAIVETERAVIRMVLEGKGALASYMKERSRISDFIDHDYDNMTTGQREMVEAVLCTQDQFIAIQGDAGTGKTYAASAIKSFMSQHAPASEVIGLSFTGKAAQSLEEESGIASSTLHSFLYKEEKAQPDTPKGRLILVDEAGMAGSLQIAQLMKVAKQNGDRVVFIGDTKQFSSIAAGDIFLDMQKYGIHTVYMSETMRQKSDHAKGIVKAVKSKKVEKAMDILRKRGSFKEQDKSEAIESIAQNYTQIYDTIDPLADELIIASRNKDRIVINERIRASLGKEGRGESHTVKEQWSQQGVARYFTKNLEEGMILIPSKVPGTKNGAEYRIHRILDEKHIELEANNGKHIVIDFYQYSQQCQLYKEVQKEFATGETIIFTKNTSVLNGAKVKNGERAVIESIENGIIQTMDGKQIDIKEMGFVDHGYAITDFKSQGATATNVTILADAQMASMNAFYTQVTRAKEDLTIYTENEEALLANLNKDAKTHSTLEYTVAGENRKVQQEVKEEIAKTIRGGGSAFVGVELKLDNSTSLLNLPIGNRDAPFKHTLVNKLDTVIQKLDDAMEFVHRHVDRKVEMNELPNRTIKSVISHQTEEIKPKRPQRMKMKF